MRKPFVAGNWKMNTTCSEAIALAQAVAQQVGQLTHQVDVAVCPPFVWLQPVRAVLQTSGVAVGAQNLSPEPNGAYTGQISAAMLVDVGCKYVIIGHSETRHTIDRGESAAYLARKVTAALAAGLVPIYCVGEKLEEREAGQTDAVNERQLSEGLGGLSAEQMSRVVIAYEPVWAIGTGKTATPQQAQDVHAYIRNWLRSKFGAEVADGTRIQYGGSMKASNAKELLSQPDVDGGLIGGASLKAEEFVAIVKAGAEK